MTLTLSSITEGISGLVDEVKGILGSTGTAAIGGAVAGSALTGAVILGTSALTSNGSKRNTKTRRKITHTKRGWKQDRARRSKQKWEVAYQKHKRKHHKKHSRSRKGKHYTKNGQPYIILKSGKARFIKRRG